MNTRIEADNPFGWDRYGFAWQHVPGGRGAHLDFGCGDGRFLVGLQSRRVNRIVGADASREAVQKARTACTEVTIMHVDGQSCLPFDSGEFASISLLDVLEHVEEQDALLGELHRVLRDDGTLIVTVPGRHVFSFLDMGNLKFCFPRLHRWFYCGRHGREEYERRYVSNPDGLIGDISARKRWHEHFSRGKLTRLLDRNGFYVVEFDGAGLFLRILKITEIVVRRLRPVHAAIQHAIGWDARRFRSANLFCIARKRTACAKDSK